MVVVMMMLDFAFGLLGCRTAAAVPFIARLTATRVGVHAALLARLGASIGRQSYECASRQATVVCNAAKAGVALADSRVALVAERDVGDACADRRQVRAVGADLHEEVLAEVHSLVAATAEVHGGAAAGQRRRRGGGGGLAAGLGRARTSGRRRAVRLHHHWRGAASAAGARASPHHVPARLCSLPLAPGHCAIVIVSHFAFYVQF